MTLPRSGSRVRVPFSALFYAQNSGTLLGCPGGGTGRRAGLKIQWTVMFVRVQVPPRVQKRVRVEARAKTFTFFFLLSYYKIINHRLHKRLVYTEEFSTKGEGLGQERVTFTLLCSIIPQGF